MYFQLGFEHIISTTAYDHILFIVTLCAVYQLKEWKQILILVTAFTIGHSITLALSSLNFIKINSHLVEILIPVTILITAISNMLKNKKSDSLNLHKFKYVTALFFGLIHGLGFSNYLKSLLGMEENIIKQLFAFNLGLEIGQILVVVVLMAVAYLVVDLFRTHKNKWSLGLSIIGLGVSVLLIAQRIMEV